MPNKQPCYHACETEGLGEENIKDLGKIGGILADTIEYYEGDLLFTATREINKSELPFDTKNGLTFEWGDPADLM